MKRNKFFRKVAMMMVGSLVLPAVALADIKMGIILGFTGPIESLTPDMAGSAELAFKEASDSGNLLGGEKIIPVRADCINLIDIGRTMKQKFDQLFACDFLDLDKVIIENQISPLASRMKTLQGMITQYFIMICVCQCFYVGICRFKKRGRE